VSTHVPNANPFRRWALFAGLGAALALPYYFLTNPTPTVWATILLIGIAGVTLVGALAPQQAVSRFCLAFCVGSAVTLGLYSIYIGFVLLPVAAVSGYGLSRGPADTRAAVIGGALGFLFVLLIDSLRAAVQGPVP